MSEHAVFADDMREIVESFVEETRDILDELDGDLLRLKEAADPSLVDKVFRAVHTIKGTSSFLGLDQLNTLAHHFEDVLNRLRTGAIAFEPGMMDVLFEAFDCMSELLQQVLDRRIVPIPLDELFADLKALSEATRRGDGPVGDPSGRAVAGPGSSSSGAPTPRPLRRGASVRVSIEDLDELMTLANELTTSRNALARIVEDLEGSIAPTCQVGNLHEETDRIGSLARDLRAAVLSTRMLTVEHIFSKFPRVARDLGRSLDKAVRVVYSGSATEVDRLVADEVGGALLHLIRNAIDHGIEPGDERAARGKPREGTITLHAAPIDRHVEISVEDDGRGLDPEAILRKAAALGRLTEQQAAALPADEVYDVIWEAGFSTKDVANQVSGRGVGLDVVRTTVSRLGGTVEIESTPGRGTRFTLSIPNAASTKRCLLVDLGRTTYALPKGDVVEVLTLSAEDAVSTCIRFQGQTVQLVRPADLLGGCVERRPPVLAAVIRHEHRTCAILLDGLHGSEDIVYRETGAETDASSFVSGVTAIAAGRVVPVIDSARVTSAAYSSSPRPV